MSLDCIIIGLLRTGIASQVSRVHAMMQVAELGRYGHDSG